MWPIFCALPDDVRGAFYLAGTALTSKFVADSAVRRGRPPRLTTVGPIMVASIQDHRRVQPRTTIYVEHGAGQTYGGDEHARDHGAYAGGRRRDNVMLFICPSERVAAFNQERYPDTPAIAVGSPKLDPWHTNARPRGTGAGIVALSFHVDLRLCPETRSAYSHYVDVLPRVAECFNVLGHGHPRAWSAFSRTWSRLGVTSTDDFTDVLDQADVYVCDNSSTLYEFASTGRPVICLNAPWYRRNVDHGLRFWSHVPGPQVDDPLALPDAIAQVLASGADVPSWLVPAVYAHADGNAARRAADGIVALL